MDNQSSSLLNWAYLCQGKSMDEMRQWLLVTTMELENTRVKAQEELKMREIQIHQLKEMVNRAILEKKEAEEKCQRLIYERLLLLQTSPSPHPLSGVSTIDDEPRSNNGLSSSSSDGSIVSSPAPAAPQMDYPVLVDKPLPENGKFLHAVMKAGPLLQTLLLAGPLPQWRYPPPPMETFQIPPPPVIIPSPAALTSSHLLHQDSVHGIPAYDGISNCGRINRKRGFFDESDSSAIEANKYLRIVL
ncbi:unnamed protein product [Cuscuta epithymum]|uniref:Uncharacterized protein n=1 Tax=Cuscuta epithymum TaxID=186058 RepID=A0AAV0FRC1_9ASTE|nr:unnamed protein product [Cuscuta epithymum]